MQRRIVPHIIDGRQDLCCISPAITVREAAQLLRDRRIGALLVLEGKRLCGIITERDITYKLVADGRDPDSVRVGEIMTRDPVTVRPDQTAAEAVDIMKEGGFRHVPVVDGERLVGIVSLRDLYEALRKSLEEDLQDVESFIQGEAYGVAG